MAKLSAQDLFNFLAGTHSISIMIPSKSKGRKPLDLNIGFFTNPKYLEALDCNNIISWRKHKESWLPLFHFLEEQHDYIQIIFPNSGNVSMGLSRVKLSKADFENHLSNSERAELIRTNQAHVLRTMMIFYGFGYNQDTDQFEPHANFATNIKNVIHHSHNLLRITRIIESLCLCGNQQLAQLTLDAIVKNYLSHSAAFTHQLARAGFGRSTLEFWRDTALEGGLTIPEMLSELIPQRQLASASLFHVNDDAAAADDDDDTTPVKKCVIL